MMIHSVLIILCIVGLTFGLKGYYEISASMFFFIVGTGILVSWIDRKLDKKGEK